MTITPGVYKQTVIIGTLLTRPDTDPETGEYLTPPEPLDGWHANVPARDMTPALEAYRVTPAHPRNVYAGDIEGTAFLRFDDEAEGVAALIGAGLIAADPGDEA